MSFPQSSFKPEFHQEINETQTGPSCGLGVSFMVPFGKGFYPFRVEYLHKKGGNDLEIAYVRET